MPTISPNTVVKHITTQTVQGEVTINLNLTLTICMDQAEGLSVRATAAPAINETKKTPDFIMHIPEIEAVEELIDFGKEV